ncbi:MAG: glycosyltransferase [Chitinispirillaceae bacterium]|nr:glycosyltransferase [Chitinispirillaceae bacterium]
MRACMLAYTYYEGDNRVRRYAEALVKRGDSVDIVAIGRPGQPSRVTIEGVAVFRIQTRHIDEKRKTDYLFKILQFLIHSFVFLTWRHLRKPYQLIHVHSVPDFEVFAAIVPRLTGARVILDIHDIVPEFFAGKFSAGKNTLLSKALMTVEKICCAFSNHVIISNHIWGERIVARSVKTEKCSVVLNYPDPAIFKGDLPRRRGGSFSMSYPGTLSRHQGLDIAIRALALVGDAIGDYRFDIYGRGGEEQALKDLAVSVGLQERIVFHGILPIDEIAKKMAMSDLGVVPKRADGFGNEAFSTKIFEFMALHVPVLISSTKIDRYYFNDSVVRFFESGNERQLADGIVFMAKHDDYRIALVKKADVFIKAYNWDIKKGEYFGLVDSLVLGKRGKTWQHAPFTMPLSHR